ncbi:MAG: hypothetical protein Q7R30_23910 [Acidobacteriota bacterium]|nr:hypothetical protein [Acidobacteriota bacterium]
MKIRSLDLLGVVAPGAASVAEKRPGDLSHSKTLIPGVALGVVTAAMWQKHPLLLVRR